MQIFTVVKAVVSLASFSVSAVCALMFAQKIEATPLVLASVFLFLAAVPWMKFDGPSRGLGLVGVMLAFDLLFIASYPFTHPDKFPVTCKGKGQLSCEVVNLLFSLGGPTLAALPYGVPGLGLLAVSLIMVWRFR
jgi:hypothetical protein